jgi:PadR family transcriptional regulator, regulatory protein PadR
MPACLLKGFLSYLVLWIVGKKSATGAQIISDIEKRKGHRPSPGTIYPVLKELKERGLVCCDKGKKYSLTPTGKKELNSACGAFCHMFFDFTDMVHSQK